MTSHQGQERVTCGACIRRHSNGVCRTICGLPIRKNPEGEWYHEGCNVCDAIAANGNPSQAECLRHHHPAQPPREVRA